MKIRATHEFPCTPEMYWQWNFDDAYNRALDRELELTEHRVLSEHQDGPRRVIRARITPKRDVPSVVRKLMRNATLAYEEERVFDPRRSRLDWQAFYGLLGDRFACAGFVSIEAVGTDSCRRILDGTVRVRVLGLGRLIEKGIASDVQQTYDRSAAFIRRWLKDHNG